MSNNGNNDDVLFNDAALTLALNATITAEAVDAEIANSAFNAVCNVNAQNVLEIAIQRLERSNCGVNNNLKAYTMAELLYEQKELEAEQRRKYAVLFENYNYDKRVFRNMVLGYLVSDDGLAVDTEGNFVGEKKPGDFYLGTKAQTEKLVKTSEVMPITDDTDRVVCNIYRSNLVAIKELIENFDMPKGDKGINELYMKLSHSSDHMLSMCKKEIENAFERGW